MKAIVVDLDLTLLRSDKSVSPYTLEVLRHCHEHGLRILAASARPMRELKRFHELIGFDAMAATNGALIALPQGLTEIGIPHESGEKILSALMCFPDAELSVEMGSGFYADRDIPAWQPTVYGGFPRLPDDTILYKILANSENSRLYEEAAELLTDDVYCTVAGGSLVQIMSVEATKWKSVQQMLNSFGIDAADAIYFGDDNDDIEPIANCGLGVAVANAIPAVLTAADHVTGTNDEDGVARFIEECILYDTGSECFN
ncbi:MAG: HAD hydrolase family protein [Oscillospiraceae bacterium]|nr:HAD hydrolase family protein [Oscillospiraceae bacterium]